MTESAPPDPGREDEPRITSDEPWFLGYLDGYRACLRELEIIAATRLALSRQTAEDELAEREVRACARFAEQRLHFALEFQRKVDRLT